MLAETISAKIPNRARRFLLVSLVMLVAGCGTLSLDIATTVDNEASFEHTMTITAEGLLAELMQGELNLSDLESQGWNASVKNDGDVWSLTASGKFTGAEAANFAAGATDSPFEGFMIEVTDTPEATEYRISLNLESADDTASRLGDEPPATTPADGDLFADFGEAMLQSIADTITISWELIAPGSIIESNADTTEGRKATWSLNLLDLENDNELYAVSRVEKSGGACSGPTHHS